MHKESKDFEVKIRKMTEKDLPILVKIGNEFWEFSDWLTLDHLKNSFDQPGLSFTAEIYNKVVGGIILVYDDIARNWIRFMVVERKNRKQGIGKLLIETIFSKLKKGDDVFLDTGFSNKNAIGFYEKMGFKNIGVVKNFCNYERECFMKKKVG